MLSRVRNWHAMLPRSTITTAERAIAWYTLPNDCLHALVLKQTGCMLLLGHGP